MNHSRFLELFWEFSAFTEQLHTLYLDSLAGYSVLHERLTEHQESVRKVLGEHECATEEFQDTCSILYINISNKGFTPVSMSPVMEQGAMRQRVTEDGHNTLLLGRQCVVSAYSYWDEYLRIEVGKALGVLAPHAGKSKKTNEILKQDVTSDFWGDLRHIRTSIVHKSGRAVDEVAKCKLLTWFSPGDEIRLPYDRMRCIFLHMGSYRNELHSLSLPEHTIQIGQ